MRAVRIAHFGPPAVMKLEEIEPPEPDAGQVLVRVHAAGVGPWDAWVRAGKSALPQTLPLTLGSDIAGRVVALGSGVHDFALGDAVFGVTNASFTGGYADYAVAPAERLAHKPTTLSFAQAAGVPVVAVTAYQMLFEHAQMKAGQRVLIHGAAGSVGACAVQLAISAGARVIATVLHPDPQLARWGVDEVIDSTRERFDERLAPVDVVIDTVGGEVQARSLPLLVRGGVLVSSVAAPEPEVLQRLGVRGTFVLVDVRRPALEQVAAAIDQGRLQVRVGTQLPLSAAAESHAMLEERVAHAPGKIVLLVAPE